ncbi:putative ubiquitin conjugating enzyme E2 [Cardiosporidium cionae]|uniref:Ubiquitin conjugating enzyme E2 n=1 Tax=Cardiosporidium cionae TaxID=476202 RepID=A0ABQ7J4L0_9APIC|nr:putative ubiquitin conjugating enzyme E2 [Cardiosporidium cionae]|eukprot:KAF8818049.1 putative ubiquitin conjugating enzyme E2 [Cardiosporidium cionae]
MAYSTPMNMRDSKEEIIVPRSFRLLNELERGQKAAVGEGISYGLELGDDISLSKWSCTIFGPPGTTFENRIYSLSIYCGEKYPDVPPEVKFNSKINLQSVDLRGKIIRNNLCIFRSWNRQYTIESILSAIRRDMMQSNNRRLSQPPEGDMY